MTFSLGFTKFHNWPSWIIVSPGVESLYGLNILLILKSFVTPLVIRLPYSLEIFSRLLVEHSVAPGAQHDFRLLFLAPSEEVRQRIILFGDNDFVIFFLSTFIVNFYGGLMGYLDDINLHVDIFSDVQLLEL